MANPIYSMTGYGKGVAEKEMLKVTVEIKTVNHRFLDLLFKLPRALQFAETGIRAKLNASLNRGHADVYLNFEDNRKVATVSLNEELALDYKELGKRLEALGFKDDLTASAIIRIPDMVGQAELVTDEALLAALIDEATTKALEALKAMRKAEGERLVVDILGKIGEIECAVNEIKGRAPAVAEDYAAKLKARIDEALRDVDVDETRFAQEVAFFVDKANIDEELTRLTSHIAHYREIFAEGGAVGKKLDFLTQETNREVNTIGSKCNDLTITKLVLFLKNEVEMVREQIQNLE